METGRLDGHGLLQQYKATLPQSEELDLVSKFHRLQSNRASAGCAGQTNPIYERQTSQLRVLGGSTATILVPDTKAHLDKLMALWLFWQQKGDQHTFSLGSHNVMPVF
ncbi:hypothetical protein CHARACLAT_004958 [Characodon lateralis]|uniref:Uncharacterized protein n=1 Tax=Characodon lateralis TaxID=208331 RepID=A0ABU7DDU6_9TELE|nr:hypothetical protein [Characodon lateralis]